MPQQVNAPARHGTEPVRVVLIPSAGGGLGRISRTATLARVLRLLGMAAARLVLDLAARQRAQGSARRLGAA